MQQLQRLTLAAVILLGAALPSAAQQTVDANSYQAHRAAGIALDLEGKYREAREHLTAYIDAAPPEQKVGAYRTMAVSYAFERDAKGVLKYGQQALDLVLAKADYNVGAEVANEIARLLLESGDFDNAATWYKTGYETALKQAALPDSARDLWSFRWHNAQARIAARRGNAKSAQAHLAMAKADLDKGTNPGQLQFLPYLTGYVAFFSGDMKTAIAQLQQAQQNDPFVLSLLAQAYEKSGEPAAATPLWTKIMTMKMHNPTNAFARPEARKRIG